MAKDYDDVGGVWRTIGGRRVFIKTGQSLEDAMKESGKFKLSKEQKEVGDKLNEKAKKSAEEDIRFYLDGNSENWDSDGDFIRELANEYGLEVEETKKMFNDIKRTNLENKYQKYVNETLNNDEYLKANRPNEYWQKQMRESGVRTFADEIKEKEDRIKLSNVQETNRHIKNATSQKSLKAMANAGYAKDITNNSFEANEVLREKHGRLERVKTIKGAYGINGAILRSRETGEYFVITARNSNIDYWI